MTAATFRAPRVLNKRCDAIPDDAYFCGRPGPLGNRFAIGRDGNRAEAVAKHKALIVTQAAALDLIATLQGRDLVCFCAPLPCHCDYLLQLANDPAGTALDFMQEHAIEAREFIAWFTDAAIPASQGIIGHPQFIRHLARFAQDHAPRHCR